MCHGGANLELSNALHHYTYTYSTSLSSLKVIDIDLTNSNGSYKLGKTESATGNSGMVHQKVTSLLKQKNLSTLLPRSLCHLGWVIYILAMLKIWKCNNLYSPLFCAYGQFSLQPGNHSRELTKHWWKWSPFVHENGIYTHFGSKLYHCKQWSLIRLWAFFYNADCSSTPPTMHYTSHLIQ